jgi:hypothetical protein
MKKDTGWPDLIYQWIGLRKDVPLIGFEFLNFDLYFLKEVLNFKALHA